VTPLQGIFQSSRATYHYTISTYPSLVLSEANFEDLTSKTTYHLHHLYLPLVDFVRGNLKAKNGQDYAYQLAESP